jgi:hypothetical protein
MGGGGRGEGCFRNFEGQIRKSSKRERNMKKKKKDSECQTEGQQASHII